MLPVFRKSLVLGILLVSCISSQATYVRTFRIAGPYSTILPIKTDTADVNNKKFVDNDILLENSVAPQLYKTGEETTDSILPAQENSCIYLIGFQLENRLFAKVKIDVKLKGQHKVFINNSEGTSKDLIPGRYDVVIKVLEEAQKSDTLSISVESEQEKYLTINPTGKRIYTLEDYMHGERGGATSLSADGRFLMMNTSITRTDGKTENKKQIVELQTGNVTSAENFKQWASRGSNYIRSTKSTDLSTLYEYVNPLNGQTTLLLRDYTNSTGNFIADETLMLVNKQTEGPKEDPQVHQILVPDDRQPGWRNRNNVQILDVKTDQLTPISIGQHNVWASESQDGKKLLLNIRESDITTRPFDFTTVLLYDRETQQADTLVDHDGFVGGGEFAPDGKSVVFSGSPEAFRGIGINDPTGKTPSMIQTELYQMNLETKQVRSITYDFNPNIVRWSFSKADGNIYAICENHDRHDIFCWNAKSEKWTKLKLSECYVNSFSLAEEKPLLSYTGQSESNSDRIYTVDLKTGKEKLVKDFNEIRMGDVRLGKCEDWNFQSERGDTIYGRYYLPADFDETKQYPMLVYYYGGCSPTGRYLDSYYNFHGWAAMGYVVYVVEPSGCTGFGQEFAARHVNAYGDYTADDIIEGTKKFCHEHPYVNSKKIGCLGASYGGFMTMYLQTKTDIFAAAMSHAGISNPASYWGYGYWGYSYNAICAANSYPWNNDELYSGHAPLFNADKVHTPILFLHGEADTNVPINESIQMFTALKILGRECAFVSVEGQNHHILDYEKRLKWVRTFYAWFAKYLQDDPTWWESMYPTKNLN